MGQEVRHLACVLRQARSSLAGLSSIGVVWLSGLGSPQAQQRGGGAEQYAGSASAARRAWKQTPSRSVAKSERASESPHPSHHCEPCAVRFTCASCGEVCVCAEGEECMISMHEAGVIECLGVDRFVHSLEPAR